MFSVIFEHQSTSDESNEALASKLDDDQIEGFIKSIRYRSLGRDGWLLLLSDWRDERSAVLGQSNIEDQLSRSEGCAEATYGFRLRVGRRTEDRLLSEGCLSDADQLGGTDADTAVVLIDARRPDGCGNTYTLAEWLGFDPWCMGCIGWDIFEAVLKPGDILLLITWRDQETAKRYADSCTLPECARLRRMRVMRDQCGPIATGLIG